MLKKQEWFESEEFWKNYGPIMFDGSHWAEAPGIAEAVCKIAGLSKGCSILEAGCGPGRVAVEFALLGLDVTGVDLIQSELDAAKETADQCPPWTWKFSPRPQKADRQSDPGDTVSGQAWR